MHKRNTDQATHGSQNDKLEGLEVSSIGERELDDLTIDDTLSKMLDRYGHQYRTDDVVSVTNHYPDEPSKESRDRYVKILTVDCGTNRRVMSCTCQDFQYRQMPKCELNIGEGTEDPRPFDVPADELGAVIYSCGSCKHMDKVRESDYEPKRGRHTAVRQAGTEGEDGGARSYVETPGALPNYKAKDYYDDERFGVLEPGAFGWDVETATRAAFADTEPSTGVFEAPRPRYLKFHSEWTTPAEAARAVEHIGPYNAFDVEDVQTSLAVLPDDARVSVGRESSPVLYIWTDKPLEAYFAFELSSRGPDELGGKPLAQTFPEGLGVGLDANQLNDGTPTLIRAWWD